MLLRQTKLVDTIIIIDNNCTDGTYDYLNEKGILPNSRIDYVKLNRNIGSAGAFYEGIKRGYEAKSDYLWLMDDDGKPYNETTFEIILNKALELREKGKVDVFLNSLVTCDGERLSFSLLKMKSASEVLQKAEDGIIRDAVNPFNGTLISKEVVEKVGYPDKNFYISYVENDYEQRCKNYGIYVATVVDSLYIHPMVKGKWIKFLGREVLVLKSTPQQEYYTTRNMFYSFRQNKNNNMIFALFPIILRTILFQTERGKKIRMILKGYIDGVSGKLGELKN